MSLIQGMHKIHMEELDLNLLTVFDALFRERSVTRAAHALGMTQSATSHAVNRLRAFFDDPLFVKTKEGMSPTRKAESLRASVLDVMATVRQDILAAARFDPMGARRVFTLCMTDMGELVFLPPLLKQLRTLAPECSVRTLQVPVEQIESLLGSGEADLAIGSIRTVPEGLFQQRLFLHSFVTVLHRDNPVPGPRLSPQAFEALPQIAVSLTGHTAEAYDNVVEQQGLQRKIAVTTPHFLTVPFLIKHNPELVATVPLELAHAFEEYGFLRTIEVPFSLPPFALHQHWHPRFHKDPAIVWLRELIKSMFENYPDVVFRAPELAGRPRA